MTNRRGRDRICHAFLGVLAAACGHAGDGTALGAGGHTTANGGTAGGGGAAGGGAAGTGGTAAAVCPAGTASGTANGLSVCRAPSGVPRVDHVFLILMENTSLATLAPTTFR